jgi:hypothetical protein
MITILKNPNSLSFSLKSSFLRFKTSYSLTAKPNLRGMVQSELVNDGTPMDTQQARFHPETRETAIDVRSAFDQVKIPLPSDASLGISTTPFFEMPDSFIHLKCRLWERYDEAPFEDNPVFSNNYNVIYGDTPVDYVTNPTYGSISHICHRYPNGYRKTVTQKQPDYVFLTSPVGFTNCSVEVTVFLSNGQHYNVVVYEDFDIEANKLLCFPAGFTQLDIYNRIKAAFPSPDIHPVSYVFAIFCNDVPIVPIGQTPLPRYMICSKNYQLDNRVPETTLYIAYENGLGGIETQYFPIYQKRRESEKETADLMLFDEADKREGEKTDTKVSYVDRYTVKSLVLPRADLENMQRISHAPIWLIHPTHFERVYADSKTVDAPPSHQNYGHFTFAFKKYF